MIGSFFLPFRVHSIGDISDILDAHNQVVYSTHVINESLLKQIVEAFNGRNFIKPDDS